MAKPKTSHERQEISRILASIDERLAQLDSPSPELSQELMGLLEELVEPSPDLVATMLAEHVVSGRSPDPSFWIQVLANAPSERVPGLLGRIARDRSVPDVIRIDTHRLANLEEEDREQQRRFLKGLHDPVAALAQKLETAHLGWLADPTEASYAVELLLLLQPAQQAEVLRRVEATPERSRVWVFHEMLQCEDEAVQRLGLASIDRIGSPWSIGALDRYTRIAPSDELADQARVIAERLRGAERHEDDSETVLPPLGLCVLSAVDETGQQTVFIVRWTTKETCLVINLAMNDEDGILSVTAIGSVPTEFVTQLLESCQEDWMELVEVDLSVVRGAIAEYVEINVEAGFPLPLGYELCEPLLHDTFPPPEDEPATRPALVEGKDAGRGNRVRRAGTLLDHPLFATWTFQPLQLVPTLLAIAPPGDEVTELPYPALLESALGLEMDEIYRDRLRRQAWLLDKRGDTRERDMALAVAASLADPKPSVLAKQPFWQGMVDRAVESLASEMEET